jgi:hypothetical protein
MHITLWFKYVCANCLRLVAVIRNHREHCAWLEAEDSMVAAPLQQERTKDILSKYQQEFVIVSILDF